MPTTDVGNPECDPCSGHIAPRLIWWMSTLDWWMSLMVMELMLIPLHVPMKMMYGDALRGHVGLDGPLGW